jgi:hypothetical protein
MRRMHVVGIVCALTIAAATAWAATNPVSIGATIDGGVLSIWTGSMTKGWFSSSNALDRSKTDLRTTWSFGATTCSAARSGSALSSVAQGNFVPLLNPAGAVVAYTWDSTVDLASEQNHWWQHMHCDGTVERHGCDQPAAVFVSTTAFAQDGTCRTYLNDAGATVCATATASTWLPAVQDPDVVDAPCEVVDVCGIGACVSQCEHACDDVADKAARQTCKRSCPCDCKATRPAGCSRCED